MNKTVYTWQCLLLVTKDSTTGTVVRNGGLKVQIRIDGIWQCDAQPRIRFHGPLNGQSRIIVAGPAPDCMQMRRNLSTVECLMAVIRRMKNDRQQLSLSSENRKPKNFQRN